MLTFVDQVSNIKVSRVSHDDEGHVVRERLGLVRKKNFSLDESLAELAEPEKKTIDDVIEFYKKSEKLLVVAALYAMPSTLRKVVEYVGEHGAELEREMLMMSLVEALRVLRKADREEAAGS